MDEYAGEEREERVGVLRGYILYRRRWLMLALFCLLSLTNALAWISFAPISRQTAQFYMVEEHWVSGLAMVYMICYIGGIWVGAWVIEKSNLQLGVVMGAILNLVGSLIRIGGAWPENFWALFLGQVVLGLAQVFILEVPPKLSANWFGSNQRSLATSIGLLANQLGVGLGFFLAPFIVHRKQELPILLFVEAGLCGVASIVTIAFFRGDPPSPPSASADLKARVPKSKGKELLPIAFLQRIGFGKAAAATVAVTPEQQPDATQTTSKSSEARTVAEGKSETELWRMGSYQHGTLLPEGEPTEEVSLEDEDEEYERQVLSQVTVAWWTRSYRRNIRELLRDRNFMILMLSFGIAVGAFYSILVLFAHMTPQTGREVGVLGMLFVSMGIAGSFVAGVVLDTTYQHSFFTKIGFGGLLFSYLWFVFEGAAGRNFIMMSFPCSSLGFFMAAIFTLCLETGVECTYPVPEGTTAGLQLLSAQFFGVIFISVMEGTRRFTIDARRYTFVVSNLLLLGALLFSFILILFFRGQNKRTEAEPEHYRR